MLQLLVAMVIAIVFLAGNTVLAQAKAKPWVVPAADKAMKPTVKLADAKVIAGGKELWMKHCKSCHGGTGKGDGTKAAGLNTLPGDFTTAAFQAQTDGEMFYKVNKGREDMPAFGKKIPDAADAWSLVAFMRTLKK